MSREDREKQLQDIMKTEGLEAILAIYSNAKGIPLGTTLSADLTRFTIIKEILDAEYPVSQS
jgi:hypothetical protein